jgi:dephospho-CoA kinase
MSAPAATPAAPACVGLTGGIASGKSTVSDLFARLGVPVIDTDLVAREVVAAGTPLRSRLFEIFGAAIRTPAGDLDRAALRRIVFEDPQRRRELESLLHPAIRARVELLAQQAGGPYQLHVVPLLVETGSAGRYARVLVVDCPENLQLQRLRTRSHLGEAEARAMLAAQASRAARLAVADDVILNDGTPESLLPRVSALHEAYLRLGAMEPRRDGAFTGASGLKHNS